MKFSFFFYSWTSLFTLCFISPSQAQEFCEQNPSSQLQFRLQSLNSREIQRETHLWIYNILENILHKTLKNYDLKDISLNIPSQCYKDLKEEKEESPHCLELPLFLLQDTFQNPIKNLALQNPFPSFSWQKINIKTDIKTKFLEDLNFKILNLSLVDSSENPQESYFVIDFSINSLSFDFNISVSDYENKKIFYKTKQNKVSKIKVKAPIQSKIIIKLKRDKKDGKRLFYNSLDLNTKNDSINLDFFYNLEDLLEKERQENKPKFSFIEFENHPEILDDNTFLNLISSLFKETTGKFFCDHEICQKSTLKSVLNSSLIYLYTLFEIENLMEKIKTISSYELEEVSRQLSETTEENLDETLDQLIKDTSFFMVFLTRRGSDILVKVNQCELETQRSWE